MDRTIDDEDCGMQIVRSSLHTGQILMEVLRWLDECKVVISRISIRNRDRYKIFAQCEMASPVAHCEP